MKTPFAICIVLFCIICSHALADIPSPDSYENILIGEDFDGEFPPSGWIIQQSNSDETWHRREWEGDEGNSHAFVENSSDQESSNEILITPKMTLDRQICNDSPYDESFLQNIVAVYFRAEKVVNEAKDSPTEHPEPFQVQISFDYDNSQNPAWDSLDDYQGYTKEQFAFDLTELCAESIPNPLEFRIGFFFQMRIKEEYSPIGYCSVAMDDLAIVHFGAEPGHHSDDGDDDDDDYACACNVASDMNSMEAGLFFTMMLIGLAALALRRK